MKKFSTILGLFFTLLILAKLQTGVLTSQDIASVFDSENADNAVGVFEKMIGLEGTGSNDEKSLSVLVFGDVMMGRFVRILMDKNGMNYPFEKTSNLDEIFPNDLIFANLEGPLKGEGVHSETSMVFGFNEDTAPLLKEKGFDVLSIANNHAIDQKWDGRDNTIKLLEAQGLGWCGHPTEAAPESVLYRENDGLKYAFVCFNDAVYDTDDKSMVELIKTVRPNVDLLIVSIHWGSEYKHSPSQKYQVDLGHAFIDAGADFIIGHHPHVIQTFEVYNGKFIFYSLGNFIFDQYWSNDTQEGLAIGINIKFEDDVLKTDVKLFPMRSEKSQARLMTDEEKAKWVEKFIGYYQYSDTMKSQIRNFEVFSY